MSNAIIIVGTDTDVGKTVFAAGVVGALDGVYWKPIQAGADPSTDSQIVAKLSGVSADRILREAYSLKLPASPHLAAEREGFTIDLARLALPDVTSLGGSRPLIIEAAGGLLVPITPSSLQIDVIAAWKKPVIVCARTTLGTINHTLLSVEALKRRAIPILGCAFIGDENPESETTICRLGGVRRLGRLPKLDPLNAATLRAAFAENFATADLLGLGGNGP